MTAQIKVRVQRKAIVKFKVLPRIPSNLVASPGLIITRSGATYTFSLDPTVSSIGYFTGVGIGAVWSATPTTPLEITTAAAAAFIQQTNSGSTWLTGPTTGVSAQGWGLYSATAGKYRLQIEDTGIVILGQAGGGASRLAFPNATSGTVSLVPPTGALGAAILTLPLATDTLVGKATTDILTNKTINGANNTLTVRLANDVSGDLPFANLTQGTARSVLAVAGNTTADFASLQGSAGQILAVPAAGTSLAFTATPTLGSVGTTGAIAFAGATSGTSTITAQPAAGSSVLTLPTTSGTFAASATGPLAINATTGVISISGAAGQVLAGSGPAFTAAPILGVAGSAVGTLGFQNATSGTITLSPPTGALGTVTLTLPAAADTLVGKATTDTLTNKSISGSSNTLSNIALSSHATQAAYTFVVNNTAGAAAPTAVEISTLTTKASPAASDYIIVSDQAASGALKKATVSSVASAGSVSSIAGNTGAFTLSRGITNSTNDIRLACPYFLANLSANQGSLSGPTKVNYDTEVFDSNGWYDNATNYRFTPLVAGKYLVVHQLEASATSITTCAAYIYKNGSNHARNIQSVSGGMGDFAGAGITALIDFNGSTDYVEAFAIVLGTGTAVATGGTGPIRSWFQATYVSP